MAINLLDKTSKTISTYFTTESLVAGRLSTAYDWSGVKTVKIMTPQTVPMVDYTRSGANRYGTPTEMEDILQEMTLTQDKAFSLTIDKGNNADQQGLKAAGRMLRLQLAERAIPTMDKYVFGALANKAGKIIGSSAALSKANVCERISAGTEALDDAEVPQEGRTLFVPASVYTYLKLSPEFLGLEKLGAKAVAKGQVGEYDGMTVIKVPKGRWPANVNFMIVYKNAAAAPVKLNDTKLHQDPPGISGNLLEGRQYYDCFVFGAKCGGIYVEVNTASGGGTVLSAPAVAASGGAFSGVTGGTYHYTTDGSDPRYSDSAKVGSAPDVTAAGTVVKCYATKNGAFPSPVTVQTLS